MLIQVEWNLQRVVWPVNLYALLPSACDGIPCSHPGGRLPATLPQCPPLHPLPAVGYSTYHVLDNGARRSVTRLLLVAFALVCPTDRQGVD